MASETALSVTDATFETEVLRRSQDLPVVVDFWAEWCGPCHMLSPVIERVAADFQGRVQLTKVNIDENPQVAARFGIQSIPTVVAFRGGAPATSFLGAQPEPEVRAFFESLLPTAADGMVDEARAAIVTGDVATARARLETALAEDPQHREATLELANLLQRLGEDEPAKELALRWPGDPAAKQILARVNLHQAAGGADRAELEARLERDERDAEAHYRLGALLAADGEWEPALEHLLEVVMLDRALDEDGGRLRMLEIFDVLGDQHPLTDEYRRRLGNVLF